MKVRRGGGEGASRFWLGVETELFYFGLGYQDMEY
jgi:hypothetical protein